MFSSSVTVRVQLSGAAVAEPHSVLVVLVAVAAPGAEGALQAGTVV